MIGAISNFGHTAGAVWMFGAGVIAVLLAVALICMGISVIRRLIDV